MRHRVRRAIAVAFACGVAAAAPAAAPAANGDGRLLRQYQPVTRFDPQERFRPTSVQSFLGDADLEQLKEGSWVVVDAEPEAAELPAPGTGVWRLNQDSCTSAAPLGGLACYGEAWEEGRGAPAVYARVAHPENRTVLQYWYFYYDNVYSYLYPPTDFVWQAHEGDWEVVNVLLDEAGQPLEVGYSQHCLGEVRPWAETPRWSETHPIVHVAVGSHANYFAPGTHPIAPACIPPAAIALLQQHGLPPPVDFAGVGELAGPPRSGGRVSPLLRLRPRTPWLDFPGFWGELQYFHAPPIGTVPFGTSPVGPAQHAVWTDPLGVLASWS